MNKIFNLLALMAVLLLSVSCDMHKRMDEGFPENESFIVPIRICDPIGRNLINTGRVKPEDVYATTEKPNGEIQTFMCRTDVTSHQQNDRIFHGLFIMRDEDGEDYLCLGCFNSEDTNLATFVLHWSDGSENKVEIQSIIDRVSDGGQNHQIYWYIYNSEPGLSICRDKYSSEITKITY